METVRAKDRKKPHWVNELTGNKNSSLEKYEK